MAERTKSSVELAYIVAPRQINLIGHRLEDLPRDALTGTTLLLRGETHQLFLACANEQVAGQVRMRLREFFDTQVRELPGATLEDTLMSGFDRIIPGDAFPVWRERGWEGGMTFAEALRWAEGRHRAAAADGADREKPSEGPPDI
ncbi:MAG: hypothetical protein LOD91_03125 [Limnochordales bacterium]|nr:hypothetical protein [Limnochordales bacterium]